MVSAPTETFRTPAPVRWLPVLAGGSTLAPVSGGSDGPCRPTADPLFSCTTAAEESKADADFQKQLNLLIPGAPQCHGAGFTEFIGDTRAHYTDVMRRRVGVRAPGSGSICPVRVGGDMSSGTLFQSTQWSTTALPVLKGRTWPIASFSKSASSDSLTSWDRVRSFGAGLSRPGRLGGHPGAGQPYLCRIVR